MVLDNEKRFKKQKHSYTSVIKKIVVKGRNTINELTRIFLIGKRILFVTTIVIVNVDFIYVLIVLQLEI